MKVLIPNTNPINFTNATAYFSYHDAEIREVNRDYIQVFKTTDRLSFQFSWIEKEFMVPYHFKVSKVVDGVETEIEETLVTSAWGGTDNKFFYTQDNSGTRGGCFFSLLFSEFITDKTCFYLKLDIEDEELDPLMSFESNYIYINNDVEATKLLHYTQTAKLGDVTFNTEFHKMIFGYDLRLPAFFAPVQPSGEREIFTTYEGVTELISAIPFQIDTLLIGHKNGIGIPDWLVRNLNYIFNCDQKTIDGIAYELTEDAEITPDYVKGYNNRFLSISMIKIEKDYNEVVEKGNNDSVYVEYTEWRENREGYIIVNTLKNWYISSLTAFEQYSFTEIAGKGVTRIDFKTSSYNTSGSDITTNLTFRYLDTNAIFSTILLTLKPLISGIGYWKIGDTFRIL